MSTLIDFSLVFLGGGTGAMFRYLISRLAFRIAGSEFPWGTVAVNLVGCFLIGMAVGALERGILPVKARPLLVAGFLGGFTTFSTYAFGSFELLRRAAWSEAFLEIFLNNVLGIALAAFGWALIARR